MKRLEQLKKEKQLLATEVGCPVARSLTLGGWRPGRGGLRDPDERHVDGAPRGWHPPSAVVLEKPGPQLGGRSRRGRASALGTPVDGN